MTITPARAAASRTSRASTASLAKGFSVSTCLPASTAARFHGHLARPVVPVPVLARLVGLDVRVPGRAEMPGGVLGGGGVAAADVPALGAPAQVHPPAAHRVAVDATRAARTG